MTPQSQKGPTRSQFQLADIAFHPAALALLLAVITSAVFWPAVSCDFLNYDDPDYFVANPQVSAGLTRESVWWAFSTATIGNWNPALWLSYMLDVQLSGHGPAGPHRTNVLLHAANAGLLFVLLRKLTGAQWRSLLVAGLFALHPLRVESVAWISERKDVLSGFFGLLALLMYAEWGASCGASGVRNHRLRFYLLALLFFILGLMSKPMLITLPFVMLLLDYWPLQRIASDNPQHNLGRLMLEKVPFLVPGLGVGAITFLVHQKASALTALADSSFTARLANAFVAYASYLGKMIVPINLALPYPRVEHWPFGLVALSAALVIGASVVAFRQARIQPFIFVGWFWFVGMLVPVIGIIQWGEQAMADRFTYLPSIGLLIFVVWTVAEMVSEWRLPKAATAGIAAGLVAACAVTTRGQLAHWRNSESLFRHALAVTENNHVAWCNLGLFCVETGRLEEGMDSFARALEIKPDHAIALNNLGAGLFHKGQVEDATLCIERALRSDPAYAAAHFNLGLIHLAARKLDEAARDFETAAQLRPAYFEAHMNLAAILIQRNKPGDAIPHLRLSLQIQPNNVEILSNLGSALAMKGELDEAVATLRQAIQISPNNAQAHFNLGCALQSQHRRDEAIEQYRETLRIQPGHAPAKQQLRALGVETGD